MACWKKLLTGSRKTTGYGVAFCYIVGAVFEGKRAKVR
jgi:hypothetical protein